jgi:hypothetical protein
MTGYGLSPMRPVHSTRLNCAGGTWSASEKSKLAVTRSQYSALLPLEDGSPRVASLTRPLPVAWTTGRAKRGDQIDRVAPSRVGLLEQRVPIDAPRGKRAARGHASVALGRW